MYHPTSDEPIDGKGGDEDDAHSEAGMSDDHAEEMLAAKQQLDSEMKERKTEHQKLTRALSQASASAQEAKNARNYMLHEELAQGHVRRVPDGVFSPFEIMV